MGCGVVSWGLVVLAGLGAAVEAGETGAAGGPLGLGPSCADWSGLGWSDCLKLRAVRLLDRTLQSNGPIRIGDFLTVTGEGDPDAGNAEGLDRSRSGKALETDQQFLTRLPAGVEERSNTLDKMLGDRLSDFFTTKTFQLTMPTSIEEQGRGKKKKGAGMAIMGAALFGSMIQMALAAIAAIAGKALIIGKIALVIAAIIALKKLVSQGGHESHQVVYATEHSGHSGGGHSGGGWGRAGHLSPLPLSAAAHELAYSGQLDSSAS